MVIFDCLVKHHPESISLSTRHGDNMLHLMSNNSYDYSMVQYVSKQYPGLLIQENHFGCIPIHLCLLRLDYFDNEYAYCNIVKVMCKANSDICKLPYSYNEQALDFYKVFNGYLALHFFVYYIVNEDFVVLNDIRIWYQIF